MTGPAWNDDDPIDAIRIANNCTSVLGYVRNDARLRLTPTLGEARRWHRDVYHDCNVPSAEYLGHFRGDASYPGLVGYEVGIGAMLLDGHREKEGVRSDWVAAQLARFVGQFQSVISQLDTVIPDGKAPASVIDLQAVVTLAAFVHGEWVRIHPFANGNGRTARIWAASVAFRYGLPAFVQIKPRPTDVAYAEAAHRSMGRSPDFVGDHAVAVSVFGHMLSLALLP